jgi:hypothetical protein
VRLQGAKRHAAERGELHFVLPVGLLYDDEGQTMIDPDEEVQAAIGDVFRAFGQTGSAYGVVGVFKGRRFPKRAYGGAWAGQLRWGELTHPRVLGVLSNPSYAGAYAFGRREGSYYECGHSRADHISTPACRLVKAAVVDELIARRLLEALVYRLVGWTLRGVTAPGRSAVTRGPRTAPHKPSRAKIVVATTTPNRLASRDPSLSPYRTAGPPCKPQVACTSKLEQPTTSNLNPRASGTRETGQEQ